ncbi:MAG: PIN domain-containing protein [Spirochaetes bacterium]|nr:PIN domain-containing protein [Spirochaetota bacterium]MBN2769695.1 PIN domain-containing protein [Spirochaetota bacterium]
MSKIFLDTNVLVYSADSYDKQKQKKALQILEDGIMKNSVVISTQVLQEFYVTATKKLGIKPLYAKEILKAYQKFEIVQVSEDIILNAIDIQTLHSFSFRDSLIISACAGANCKYLYTEDLQHNQKIGEFTVINPFSD